MSMSWLEQLERASHHPEFMTGATLMTEVRTNELKDAMCPYGAYESKSEARHREDVVATLSLLVRQWTREETLKKGHPAYVAHFVGGHVCPFGSYMLRVRDLRAAEDAFVPSMKFTFKGIRFNLLYAKLNLPRVKVSLNLRDNALLKDMDPRCLRSLSCYRATEEILRLVPNPNNFKRTLRAIKLWAKRRGVYSNSLGFLDGVSLAMLVAYTCILYPEAHAATLVHRFFCVVAQWKWPEIARQRRIAPDTEFPFWDSSVNVPEFFGKMRIVTPIFPEYDNSFNMTESTRNIVMDEIATGLMATVDIFLYKNRWSHLFECSNFFDKYKHYLVLLAFSATPDDQPAWRELVEAKIPNFIQCLDRNHRIHLAHLNPVCYNSVPLNTNYGQPQALQPGTPMPKNSGIQRDEDGAVVANCCSMWFVGLTFKKNQAVDLSFESDKFSKVIDREAIKSKLQQEGILVEIDQVERDQLYQYLSTSLMLDEPIPSSEGLSEDLFTSPQTTKRAAESDDSPAPKRQRNISTSDIENELSNDDC
ncbi:hypothetical protein SFRURICE_001544 [Spodoptera frugiperda]|nr:hypothetical protein SFRURICE_001544 [Spodoptera frugiperda]